MDTPIRLPKPKSLLGRAAYPFRWAAWRLLKPAFLQLHAANTARTDAKLHHLAARLEAVEKLTAWTREHAENILGLTRDAHTRCNNLQEHTDNILGVARDAGKRADAAMAQATVTVPAQSISPLMAQAITLDHRALARRIAMIENLLVELQAGTGAEAGTDATVLPLPTPAQRRLVS